MHEQHTPRTITDPGELAAQLDEVRRQGVAFDIEERDMGTCAVAAPVRDQTGKVIATLAVVVPTGRFDEEAQRHAPGCERHRVCLLGLLRLLRDRRSRALGTTPRLGGRPYARAPYAAVHHS